MFKPSGNPKVEELTKSVKERSYNLSCLRVVKLPELDSKGKPKRLCAWCVKEELSHGNMKYCSTDCSTSAMAWAYPQKEDSLRFLLLRQEWKCLGCGYDYIPLITEILAREKRMRGNSFTALDELPWYYFKRLKSRSSKDRKPEIDHVVAISKGGASLGLDNHQCLCYTCHKIKTSKDNSGPRKKKEII